MFSSAIRLFRKSSDAIPSRTRSFAFSAPKRPINSTYEIR